MGQMYVGSGHTYSQLYAMIGSITKCGLRCKPRLVHGCQAIGVAVAADPPS